MQEHQISEYDQLTTEAEAASARFHALTEQLRQTEADLAHTSELMGAVVQYIPQAGAFRVGNQAESFPGGHIAPVAYTQLGQDGDRLQRGLVPQDDV